MAVEVRAANVESAAAVPVPTASTWSYDVHVPTLATAESGWMDLPLLKWTWFCGGDRRGDDTHDLPPPPLAAALATCGCRRQRDRSVWSERPTRIPDSKLEPTGRSSPGSPPPSLPVAACRWQPAGGGPGPSLRPGRPGAQVGIRDETPPVKPPACVRDCPSLSETHSFPPLSFLPPLAPRPVRTGWPRVQREGRLVEGGEQGSRRDASR